MKPIVARSVSLLFSIWLGITCAEAITLDFLPASQTVVAGQPFVVDLVVSGLATPPSVGAFDLDVSFDPSILTPVDVVFGHFLGDPSLLEAITGFSFSPGIVDLAAVSLLSDGELDSRQTGSFSLATLFFSASGAGISPLFFSEVIVDDAFGEKLDVVAGTGAVEVVPEPSTAWLLGPALAVLGACHWGRRHPPSGNARRRRREPMRAGIYLASTVVFLFAWLLAGPAHAAFKKVNKDADPATNLEYEISYAFQFNDNNTNQIWTTTVVVKNTDAANAQKVMLCLQGVTHPLKTGTAPRTLVNVTHNNAAKRFQCAPAGAAEEKANRYGNLGCQVATIPRSGMHTFTFVAGQRPNPEAAAAFAVQDGIYRNSMNGAGFNGPGHRTATLRTFALGANKSTRIVRQAIDELRLHFIVLKDATIDMACRSGFAAAGGEPAYNPPCAMASQSAGPPACNLGFGMNFEFALPAKAIQGVTIHKEAVKWNPGDLKKPDVTLTQLDIPFGVESAVAEEDFTGPFSAYLRVTLPSGFPPSQGFITPPENTYFTVFPGSGQYGTITLHSLPPDFAGDFVITVRKADSVGIPAADRDIQADEVVVENVIPIASSELCDYNQDQNVNIRDINESFAYRGLPADPPDDYDLDANGTITVNDARICTLKCTKAKCAE